MLTITVTNNVPAFMRSLDAHGRQVPFATALALTRTVQATMQREAEEIARVFDHPIERTRRGVFYRPANKAELVATVGIRTDGQGIPVARYIEAEVEGGARHDKRSERALKARFPQLRGQWVPGPGVKLNAYGNVAGGTMQRILADLATPASGKPTGRRRGRIADRFFVPTPGSPLDRRARGVWVRKGRAVMPALIFVAHTAYAKRFDFFGIGRVFVAERFPVEFDKALAIAFETARP